MNLTLNNLQRLICHKAQQTKPNQTSLLFTRSGKERSPPTSSVMANALDCNMEASSNSSHAITFTFRTKHPQEKI